MVMYRNVMLDTMMGTRHGMSQAMMLYWGMMRIVGLMMSLMYGSMMT